MNAAPQLKLLVVSRIKRKNSRINTTDKNCFVISCRIKGKSLFLYNNKTTSVKPGDILYIPEGSDYKQETESEEVIYIHFDSYSQLPKNIKIFSPSDCGTICNLFNKCYKEYAEKEKNYQYRCMSILYEILAYMELNENDCTTVENHRLASALNFMNLHMYSVGFSIELLCRKCGISRTYFNLLFKEKFNVTPVSYINKSRIDKAKILLDSGDYRNDEISSLCGFDEIKYFYAVFKKITGMTPKEYKFKRNAHP